MTKKQKISRSYEEDGCFVRSMAGVLLILIIIYFLFKMYAEISISPLVLKVFIGSNNADLFTRTISLFIAGLFLIAYFSRWDFYSIVSYCLEFIFLTAEISIAALVGLAIFISATHDSNSAIVDTWGRPIYLIIISVFLYIVLRKLKEILIDKGLIRKSNL